MGGIFTYGTSVTALRHRIRSLARQLEVRMLVIDEIHSLLAGSFREQRIFLNAIRFLANDLRLPLVCARFHESYPSATYAFSLDLNLDDSYLIFLARFPECRLERSAASVSRSRGLIRKLRFCSGSTTTPVNLGSSAGASDTHSARNASPTKASSTCRGNGPSSAFCIALYMAYHLASVVRHAETWTLCRSV
jgi:hypothetical protein